MRSPSSRSAFANGNDPGFPTVTCTKDTENVLLTVTSFINHHVRLASCVVGILLFLIGLERFGVDYPIVVIVFSFYTLFPGLLLQRLIFNPPNYLEKAAYIFSLGFLWNGIIFGFLSAVGFSFHSVKGKLAPAILIVALAVFARKRLPPSENMRHKSSLSSTDFVVALICLGFSVSLQFSESATILGSDGLTHIDTISRLAANGSYGKLGHDFKDIILRTRLWHDTIQPYFLQITSADGIKQYLILTSLITPFVVCSFYTFTRSLLPFPSFHLLSILLFVMHFGGFISNFSHGNYSWYVCWALIFCAVTNVIGAIRRERGHNWVLGLALGGVIILYHFNYILIFIGTVTAIVLSYLFWVSAVSRTKKLIAIFSLLFILFIPAVLSVSGAVPFLSPDATMMDHINQNPRIHTAYLFGKDVVVSYTSYLRWSGLLGALAIFLLPLLWWSPKSADGNEAARLTKGYLTLGMLLPFAVVFNPAYVLLGYTIISEWGFYIYRLFYICPYISVIAFTLSAEQGSCLSRYPGIRKGLVIAVFLCVLPVFVFQFLHYVPASLAYSMQKNVTWIIPFHRVPFRYDHTALMKAMAYIKQDIGHGYMFVSDPFTSWMISAATSNDVLNKTKRPQKIRQSASMKVLSPLIDRDETKKILKKYNIDYVLINTTFDEQIYEDYFSFSEGPTVFLSKFHSNPELFELFYERDGIFIFRVRKD
jgi:hypothetical protein